MLDLRENKITELPTVMSEMKCLSILLLSSNHLKAIPEGFLLNFLKIILKKIFLKKLGNVHS